MQATYTTKAATFTIESDPVYQGKDFFGAVVRVNVDGERRGRAFRVVMRFNLVKTVAEAEAFLEGDPLDRIKHAFLDFYDPQTGTTPMLWPNPDAPWSVI